MMVSTSLWLLVLLLGGFLVDDSAAEENVVFDERAVLVEFFQATGGLAWKTPWQLSVSSNDNHHCSWWGVTCNGTTTGAGTGSITALQLPNNNVAYSIPASLYTLPALAVLDLRGNPIQKAGFEGLSASSVLTDVDFTDTLVQSVNGLDGAAATLSAFKLSLSSPQAPLLTTTTSTSTPFPQGVISKLTSLQTLHLASNGFTGALSSGLDQLLDLRELYLFSNKLTGTIPVWLGLLPQLRILSLADNAWTGGIPASFNNLVNLQVLSLKGRGGGGRASSSPSDETTGPGLLTGPIPAFDKAMALHHVFLDHNALTGSIPETFLRATTTTTAVTVDLAHNRLVGGIPEELSRFDSLNLQLTENSGMVGALPESFCQKSAWMNGAVAQYGCDAILCAKGSYSATGQAPCLPCDNLVGLGARSCGDDSLENVIVDPAAQQEQQSRILAELYLTLDGPIAWAQGWPELDAVILKYSVRVDDAQNAVAKLDLSGTDACNWYGVMCNAQGFVEILTLTNNRMLGTVPDTLFHLPDLQSIDFSYNRVQVNDFSALQYAPKLTRLRLSHTAVTSMTGIGQGGAHELKDLFLDGCDFHGSAIPVEFYSLTALDTLHLEASFLGGTIAPEIQQLSNLRRLHLNENSIEGSIPKEVAALSALEYLDLSDNAFQGAIPSEFNNMNQLLSLRINTARGGLGGPLPSFAGLSKIEELELAFNAFTGPIPSDFLTGSKTDGRIKVRLTGNQLDGEVPASLVTLGNLVLEIEDNKITSIPDALCTNPAWMDGEVGLVGNCDAILCPAGYWSQHGKASTASSVTCEPCEGNDFFGETACETKGLVRNSEVEILDKLFRETGGRYWNVTHGNWTKPGVPICYREGVVCGWKPADMNSDVTELRLSGYGLRGRIPSEIFQLPKIRRLAFASNPVDLSFEGIQHAEILEILALSHTDVGTLAGIENARDKLYNVNVAATHLKGKFPTEILEVASLKGLSLGQNRLSGTLPSLLGAMLNLQQLDLGSNDFVGQLPPELGALANMQELLVNDNRLSGIVPTEFNDLDNLVRIDLSGQRSERKFTGPFPPFSAHPQLTQVNASWNAFEGPVPPSLLSAVDKASDVQIDLSNNKFTGGFPTEFGAFQMLFIDLTNNMIDALSTDVCGNPDWMHGITGVVGSTHKCATILCEPGTFAPQGRQKHRGEHEECRTCTNLDEAPFFGSTACFDPSMKKEREVLVKLAEETCVEKWFERNYWLDDRHVCTWYGVTCNVLNYVTKLNLADNGLKQSPDSNVDIVALLSKLPNLKVESRSAPSLTHSWLDLTVPSLAKDLVLDNNELVVNLRGISKKSTLQSLSLSNSGLKSLVGIGRAKSLTRFEAIGNNGLRGTLPAELLRMTSLRQLYLSSCGLTGTLPDALFAMTNLEELSLPDNEFHGTIPRAVASMKKLRGLSLSENKFSGSIPSEMNELAALERLALSSQNGQKPMDGPLIDFAKASNLWSIDLSDNSLSGEIPEGFLGGSEITAKHIIVDMASNNITGTIPPALAKFSRLSIDLTNNKIASIPSALCHQSDWLDGDVGMVGGCDAILCPQGFFAADGRQVSIERPCLRCESLKVNSFLGQTECLDVSERTVLLDIFAETGGEKWIRSDNWNSNDPICSWFGIVCDGDTHDDGGITSIRLPYNNLAGSLPPEAMILPSLLEVNLSGNRRLHVSLQGVTEKISSLERFNVTGTNMRSLDGISQASHLKHLAVSGVSGTFPAQLFELASTLETLDLSNSFLVGTLPTRIGELTNLKRFLVPSNDLHGTLPTEIAQLWTLEDLDLSENLLSGALPSTELSSMVNLKRFSISRKDKSGRLVSGPLPSFNKTPALVALELDGARLSGSVPIDFLAGSVNVETVDISRNQLSGILPSRLSSQLGSRLVASGNKWSSESTNVTAVDERAILVELYQSCGGEQWNRNDFWSSKVDFCSWYGVACDNERHVVLVNLPFNNLVGPFTERIFDLPALQILWLSGNPGVQFHFDGIQKAKKLRDLKIDYTGLTSLVGLGLAKGLTAFNASSNLLKGPFPDDIFQLENIRVLSLSNNTLDGVLPSSLLPLKYLRILEFDRNKFQGEMPSFSDSVALTRIDLGWNELHGSIPSDFLFSVPSFVSLNVYLQGNMLTGSLPQELKRFDSLTIDVQRNRIGAIPAALCERANWNAGAVAKYGCGALACAPGTSNTIGRQSAESPKCFSCPAAAPYFGQTTCSSGSAGYAVMGALFLPSLLLLVNIW